MRFAVCYYTHKPGGFCKRLYRLINALITRGHAVTYITLDAPPDNLLADQVDLAILPFPIKRRSGPVFWILFTLLAPIILYSRIAQLKPDRIIAFSTYYSAICGPAAISNNIPIVLFVRTKLSIWCPQSLAPSHIVEWAFNHIGLLLSSRVCTQTAVLAKRIESLYSRQTQVIPNDIGQSDIAHSLNRPPPGDRLQIVTSGSLTSSKNVALLVRTIALLHDNSPGKFKLTVLGSGLEYESLKANGLTSAPGDTFFPGWVDNVAGYLANADIYIHPSKHEGMPNSLLEALGAGLPILVADTPELRELVKFKLLTFNPSDPKALANRLYTLLTDTRGWDEIVSLSEQVRRKFEFDWETSVANFAAS